MNKVYIENSAVITSFGLFEYLFLPFGQRNSSSKLQRFMDNIFMGECCIFVCIDDILAISKSKEQYQRDHKEVL